VIAADLLSRYTSSGVFMIQFGGAEAVKYTGKNIRYAFIKYI